MSVTVRNQRRGWQVDTRLLRSIAEAAVEALRASRKSRSRGRQSALPCFLKDADQRRLTLAAAARRFMADEQVRKERGTLPEPTRIPTLSRPTEEGAHGRRRIAEHRRETPGASAGQPPAQVAHVAVNLVGARSMSRLNECYLGHTGTTDVITFDYCVPARSAASQGGVRPLHGDIVICLDEARRQAGEFDTAWPEEVVRYLVHGLLHLHGYDDLEPKARRIMKRAENRIVRRLAADFAFKRIGGGSSVPA